MLRTRGMVGTRPDQTKRIPRIVNSQLMGRSNRAAILDIIRTSGPISQADIVTSAHVGNTTVSDIMRELREGQLVQEVGSGQSAIGRKPRLWQFNPKAGRVLAADVDVDRTYAAALDLSGNVEGRAILPSGAQEGQEKVLTNLQRALEEVLAKLSLVPSDTMGIGISFDGEVDTEGSVIWSGNLGWRDVPLGRLVEERCGTPVFVEHNMRAMALAEHWFGSGRDVRNLVCVYVGGGVGAGIIIDGKPYRGMHGRAGEVGHTSVVAGGPMCTCGKQGCLELFAARPAIIRRAEMAIADARESAAIDSVLSAGGELTLDTIFGAAQEGDKVAKRILEETGFYIGVGVANAINNFDPEVVVLAGDVIDKSRGMLIEIVRDTAKAETVDGTRRTIEIREGVLRENAGVIGAATLVYQDIFRSPLHA